MFRTDFVMQLWRSERARIEAFWRALGSCSFGECDGVIHEMGQAALRREGEFSDATPDEIVNDHFVLSAVFRMLHNYSAIWHCACTDRFAESWTKLQDTQDSLRTIFRFASQRNAIFTSLVEHQCGQLELLYPYNLFASVEMAYDSLECSICGRDMSDAECCHLVNELYRGQVAHGIYRGITQLHAVALVKNPMDKRCVFSFPDDKEHFPLVAYLASLISKRRLDPLRFGGVMKKTVLLSPSRRDGVGRNSACPCGSGLKFKKCCLLIGGVKRSHFEILGEPEVIVGAEAVVELRNGCIAKSRQLAEYIMPTGEALGASSPVR